MVDNSSRFKFWLLLKKKLEALDKASEFLSSLKSMQAPTAAPTISSAT